MVLVGLVLLGLAGCDRGFFRAKGYVASDGGPLGMWRSAPEGCSRDPFDGQPAGQTASVATFVWEDPSVHDPYRDKHRRWAPDAPMRLEIARAGTGFVAGLTTVKTHGTRIAMSDCTVFTVQTWERPAALGDKASLGGRVRMDCSTQGSRVTADFEFGRCEF